ncbi:MAG TPA: hypothetical protein VMJ10_03835 [Kofleriaceae bacterium]|nr:hypothetical protein [Kofleriaceae bacterium]
MKRALALLAACSACSASHASGGLGPDDTGPGDACAMPAPTAMVADLLAHNTSANAAYDAAHFPANFGSATWISQAGATMPVDPAAADLSLNAVTPGHVSNVDVHTLIPSRPDLRWFAHVVPWFRGGGGGGHIDIGIETDSAEYVAAMLADLKRRGFDGLIVDWYGQGSYEDQVTLLVQQALAADPTNTFTFIVMMDKGIPGLSSATLVSQLAYLRAQYWSDRNYERESGKPIVMFFGVDSALGATAMTQIKAASAPDAVWVTEGASSLAQSYVDEAFDWTHADLSGPVADDPYNVGSVAAYYAAVGAQAKPAFGSIAAGFDGMLTKTVAWSEGKYLPRGDGACIVQWASKIDSVIPANVTRMQWATWNDWEEGTAVEPGVENSLVVAAAVDGGVVSWTVTGGTGDESTVDHYEVYATLDSTSAYLVGSAPVGAHSFSLASSSRWCWLSGATSASVSVVAVAKPMLRDHASPWLPLTPP